MPFNSNSIGKDNFSRRNIFPKAFIEDSFEFYRNSIKISYRMKEVPEVYKIYFGNLFFPSEFIKITKVLFKLNPKIKFLIDKP